MKKLRVLAFYALSFASLALAELMHFDYFDHESTGMLMVAFWFYVAGNESK